MTQRYIGIDVHTKSCTLAVLGPTGRRLKQWQVETDRKVLVEAVRSVAGERYICFEEGTHSDWLYEILEPVATEVEVIQPPKRRGIKNDAVDAWAAAEAMRIQSKEVTRVFKAPERFTALRKAVRAHLLVQQDVVRVKNRIHACYRARGITGFDSADIYRPDRRTAWLDQLPPCHRRLAEHFSRELDGLLEARDSAERWLTEEAEKVSVVRLLSTAPAISIIRASQIVAVVLSPQRFRTRSQFWAYCGLGVVMRSSADWQQTPRGWERTYAGQTRGLNRNRNPLLKNVFKGAAITLLHMKGHPLSWRFTFLEAAARR